MEEKYHITIRQILTNSLSCEPILRRMPNGELLCVCEHGGVTEPAPENRIFVYHSRDNGKSWSGGESIRPEDGRAVCCTDVFVSGGEITAYLMLHNGRFLDWKCLMMKSRDNGYTWQEAGAPPFFPEYTLLRGSIAARDGRTVTAYQHYPITKEANDRAIALDQPIEQTRPGYCENGVLIRTGGGEAAKYPACRIPLPENGWIWTEPTIAELSDGTIAMLMRRDGSGSLWRCDSADGGMTWGEMYDSGIPNPGNKPKLIQLDNGRIALLNTPNGDLTAGWRIRRFPLELWISDDDMKTWTEKIRLTDFPGSYDYSDGFYEDGHILFTIEHNRHTVLFFDIELHF